MNKEEWRDVKGYEGLYKVSNFGNVKSIDRWVSSKCNSKKIHEIKNVKTNDKFERIFNGRII